MTQIISSSILKRKSIFLMKNGEFEVQHLSKTVVNIMIGSLQFQTQVKIINRKQLTIFIKEKRRKYRATAENIQPSTGNVSSKMEDINSTTRNGPNGEEEIVTCKYVPFGGYIRWNIEFLD